MLHATVGSTGVTRAANSMLPAQYLGDLGHFVLGGQGPFLHVADADGCGGCPATAALGGLFSDEQSAGYVRVVLSHCGEGPWTECSVQPVHVGPGAVCSVKPAPFAAPQHNGTGPGARCAVQPVL